MNPYIIYSDGCCRPNPGLGGIGVVIIDPDGRREEFRCYEPYTTSNRAEMLAAIVALTAVPPGNSVKLFTDSRYLVDGMTRSVPFWSNHGDGTVLGKMANDDLWVDLCRLTRQRKVEWIWVRGHAGNPGNERAHELAQCVIERIKYGPGKPMSL